MMKKVVIDSCVFVKLFLDEDDYHQARNFIHRLSEQNITILVPAVFTYEVYYISQKYGVDLDFIDQLISEHQDYNMKEIGLNNEIIKQTKEIIQNTTHLKSGPKSGFPSFYDASYHALAMLNDCDFITADKRHYEKTKELGNIKLLAEMQLPFHC